MNHDAPVVSDLPRFIDPSGELCFMQVQDHIPFAIDQVSWVHQVGGLEFADKDVPTSSEVVIVALAGGFDVAIRRGDERAIRLDRAYRSLYVPVGYRWAVRNRSRDAIALVLSAAAADKPGRNGAVNPVLSNPRVDGRRSTIEDCAIVELPQREGPWGVATFLRQPLTNEVQTRRVYYLTDIQQGASRGAHAHRELHQLVLAARGSFKVRIDDGQRKRTVTLSRPDRALHLVPGIWRTLHGFSAASICLVMASRPYEEHDYLRDHGAFRAFKRS